MTEVGGEPEHGMCSASRERLVVVAMVCRCRGCRWWAVATAMAETAVTATAAAAAAVVRLEGGHKRCIQARPRKSCSGPQSETREVRDQLAFDAHVVIC